MRSLPSSQFSSNIIANVIPNVTPLPIPSAFSTILCQEAFQYPAAPSLPLSTQAPAPLPPTPRSTTDASAPRFPSFPPVRHHHLRSTRDRPGSSLSALVGSWTVPEWVRCRQHPKHQQTRFQAQSRLSRSRIDLGRKHSHQGYKVVQRHVFEPS